MVWTVTDRCRENCHTKQENHGGQRGMKLGAVLIGEGTGGSGRTEDDREHRGDHELGCV